MCNAQLPQMHGRHHIRSCSLETQVIGSMFGKARALMAQKRPKEFSKPRDPEETQRKALRPPAHTQGQVSEEVRLQLPRFIHIFQAALQHCNRSIMVNRISIGMLAEGGNPMTEGFGNLMPEVAGPGDHTRPPLRRVIALPALLQQTAQSAIAQAIWPLGLRANQRAMAATV
jgi:hypothetical protein